MDLAACPHAGPAYTIVYTIIEGGSSHVQLARLGIIAGFWASNQTKCSDG